MIKFDVFNRFSGAVQFTAEVDCEEYHSRSIKLGLAVKWAIDNKTDLWGADLGGADLRGADLEEANLGRADLWEANLRGANLRGVNLGGADLWGTDLRGADLRGADLRGADLREADIRKADLVGADLGGEIGKIEKTPIFMYGFPYNVTIYDKHAEIGCKLKTFEDWLACDIEEFQPVKTAFEAVLRASGRIE